MGAPMRRIVVAGIAVVLAAALGPPASAQRRDPADPGATPPGSAPPRIEPPTGHRGVPDRIDATLRFTARDRGIFESWVASEYGRGKCPPGLAKKEGSLCLPRGAPHKRYQVGLPLPPAAVIAPVPLDLTRRLGTPAVGYRYGIVDGDLVKLELARGVVLDAIDGYVPK